MNFIDLRINLLRVKAEQLQEDIQSLTNEAKCPELSAKLTKAHKDTMRCIANLPKKI